MEYVIDGEVLTVDCLMCAVCNGRAYGGGFMAGPEAQPDDGWLDVFIVRKVSRRVIAKLLMLYKTASTFKTANSPRPQSPTLSTAVQNRSVCGQQMTVGPSLPP